MSKKKPHQSKRALRLFDPDRIATQIHQALVEDQGSIIHEYDTTGNPVHFAHLRQCNELLKKFVSSSVDQASLQDITFKNFLKTNRRMGKVNLKLRDELSVCSPRLNRSTRKMDKIHLRAKALMSFVLTDFEKPEWFVECRNSSGSSIGVPFVDTSIERKFSFPMSVTKGALSLFNESMAFNENLKEAVVNYNSRNPLLGPYNIVRGSSATTVDKTSDKRRMICVEPTCNMYLQQGLMHMMYKRMKVVGLDVESLPDLHKQLAKESSITGKNATIDWSSASDSVSVELLRWLLPPKWFAAVILTRSPFSTINGVERRMNMISTMGNAVTFPLETLVFWTYAHATILTENTYTNSLFPEWEDLMNVSVFGDDCIVPTNIASRYIEVMEEVGFIVNDDKSYYGTEQFRESCGGDYLTGFDVRPFSLKAPHSNRVSSLEPWLYIIANSLLKKYMVYFGKLNYVYDRALWRLLFGLFAEYKIKIKLVPAYFPDDAGLKISHDILRFYHQYEMKLSPVYKDTHGTYTFNYCSFKYRNSLVRDDGIRLASWLQRPVQTSTPSVHEDRKIRRLGGYVVAKGLSCHWHVPVINPVA